MGSCFHHISAHDALTLLRHSFSIPKLRYLLRTAYIHDCVCLYLFVCVCVCVCVFVHVNFFMYVISVCMYTYVRVCDP